MLVDMEAESPKLAHILRWWELPDGAEINEQNFSSLMSELGDKAAAWAEELGGVKGMMSARKNSGRV